MADVRHRRKSRQVATEWLSALLVVVAAGLIGLASVQPPQPEPREADPARFSAERAIEHVERIATEPHPMGSRASAQVRGYLINELERLGLSPQLQSVVVPDYYGSAQTVTLVNVMARIPGRAPTKAVALMGHYDTVPTSPGANDNSAAVAAILEAARPLVTEQLRNDVILLFTDGEEPAPRYGASAFVTEHPWARDIGIIVNLEAAGGAGPSILTETSGPEGWLLEEAARAAPDLTAFSFITDLVDLLGGIDTDFTPFRHEGIRGLNFAYLQGSPIYHTNEDKVDRVSLASLQHHGSLALTLARHFGDMDLNARPDNDGRSVYFRVADLQVRYPQPWAVPVALASAVVFGLAVVRRMRAGGASALAVVRGAAVVTVAVLVGSIVAACAWWALTRVRTMPTTTESYLYLLGLVLLAAAVAGVAVRAAGSKPGRIDTALGAGLVWVALALLTAFVIPGASYVFSLPALAGALGLSWRMIGQGWQRVVRFAIVAVPTVVVGWPVIQLLFEFAQPRPGNPDSEVVATVTVPVLLALLAGALILGAAAADRAPRPAPGPAHQNGRSAATAVR